MENGVGNLEFLACIPGSIGGAVIMNSGCYGDDISKILLEINVIDLEDFKEKKIINEKIKFFYRGTNLPQKFIITSVKLKGEEESKIIIEKKQNTLLNKKKMSQPNRIKTCGSTFKNFSEEKRLGN